MATIPTPRTWTQPYTVTASDLNGEIRDAVNFLLNPPKVLVTASTTTSAANGAWTPITFDTEVFDSDGMHSTASNTGRLTVVTPGVYLVGVASSFASNGTGSRGLQVRVNSAGAVGSGLFVNEILVPVTSVGTALGFSDMYQMNAGDYFEAFAFQNSGGALATSNAHFEAIWMSI